MGTASGPEGAGPLQKDSKVAVVKVQAVGVAPRQVSAEKRAACLGQPGLGGESGRLPGEPSSPGADGGYRPQISRAQASLS